ncbi:LrgB family protein [Carboxylicivirga linearis]|uniref:LrgB family protein n=1 Tax=Carboxylicivirga linearis TaxID=1628157 RepID=A0ABS5JS10_9BACT|nr:LrgB family protein [Carboxylicivirga linearis]MBS2097595.1 LrgB family protein [Carboxylicivirga linearis]
MTETLTNTHLFGILLTLGLYYGCLWLRKRLQKNYINPLLISAFLIIIILTQVQIPYEHYTKGANFIHAFLGPVTVVLALPLYRQRKLLVQHKFSILGGIFSGVAASFISVIVLCRVFHLNEILERSLIPHSVTTPIGIAVSNSLEAIEGITVISIIITGLLGASIAKILYRILRITHPIAKGLTLGTSAHVLGTTKAIEMGETEGAVSSLAIGVAAITTVIMVTVLQVWGLY